jgi:hypothetical protein
MGPTDFYNQQRNSSGGGVANQETVVIKEDVQKPGPAIWSPLYWATGMSLECCCSGKSTSRNHERDLT